MKASLRDFIAVFHFYRHSEQFTFRPFHLAIIRRLEGMVFQEVPPGGQSVADEKRNSIGGVEDIRNLYIGMPPRFGKTQIVKYFVAWSYAVNPACNYILTSYGAELVADTSKYIRELVSSELYQTLFPGVRVDNASSAADLWRIKGGGGFRAATLDGVVTGFGAGTAEGKIEYCHTLNGSGLATSRILPALVEQNQNADGSVNVPDVLRKYLGCDVLKK